MPPLSLLIKPTSSSCNLGCSYCFYADVSDQREIKNYGFMSKETMKLLIDKSFTYGTQHITFAFQGGEPTLIGLGFYKEFVEEVEKTNINNLSVSYALQTNGTLVDEEMAIFFAQKNFLLGVSLDGPKDIHDMNRKDHKGKGSYKEVQKAIQLLKKHSVAFNILTVVNKGVGKHPEKIYNFLKKEGYRYMQFIPCLDKLGEVGEPNPYALDPATYTHFLSNLFDLWYKDFMSGDRYSIRMFDNIVQMLMGYPPESCDMTGNCSLNLVVEADGSVYPCDFYVLDEWRLGSIYEDDLSEMIQHSRGIDFMESSKQKDDACMMCSYYPICRGGCRRHRAPDSISPLTSNYYCETYKAFYEATLDRFYQIAKLLQRG